jgi:hypothetical protein
MTLAEAIDTLRKHNAWRTGETLEWGGWTPRQVTEAIRLVCDAATLRKDDTK